MSCCAGASPRPPCKRRPECRRGTIQIPVS
jgi:hypothetical protein